MADVDVEKSSYSGFERFLFFVTPIIFTIVLLVVLLALFNYPVRNSLLTIANKIPIVNQWLPEPTAEPNKNEADDSKPRDSNLNAKLNELNQLIAAKDAELKKATAISDQKQKEVDSLQQQIQSLEKKFDTKTQNDSQYQEQITSLANMYAKISPSKAAPIIENLTLEEQVLVLHAMKADDRVKILEKMNPKTAASATIRLKDLQPSEDMAIAALQSRLNLQDTQGKKVNSTIDNSQLSQTFTSMTPKNAAKLVMETAKINQEKALRILSSVDDATRSRILGAMADTDTNTEVAAKLLSKLMPAK